jgi:hypothetical protein
LKDDDGNVALEYRTPYEWRQHFDNSEAEWPLPWTVDSMPVFGSLVNIVLPKELQDVTRKVEPRGTPAIFVGVFEHKGGRPDGSIIAVPLQKMLETGRITFMRTKDFRKPRDLQFPMKTLRDQL